MAEMQKRQLLLLTSRSLTFVYLHELDLSPFLEDICSIIRKDLIAALVRMQELGGLHRFP